MNEARVPTTLPNRNVPARNSNQGDAAPTADLCVNEAIALLTAQLAHPWQLTALAAAVQLSPRQLERRFKAVTGESPLQYLRTLRLQQAAARLAMTYEPIHEIAAAVGSTDRRHFRRSFHAVYGLSPTAYRWRAWRHHVVFDPQMSQLSPLSKIETGV